MYALHRNDSDQKEENEEKILIIQIPTDKEGTSNWRGEIGKKDRYLPIKEYNVDLDRSRKSQL